MKKQFKIINSASIKPSIKPQMAKRICQSQLHNSIDQIIETDRTQETQHHSYAHTTLQKELKIKTKFNNRHHLLTGIQSEEKELASSFSFEEYNTQHQYQKLLFCKFLQIQSYQWLNYIPEMTKIEKSTLNQTIKIGETESSIFQNRLISHYIGVWLLSMGYQQPQTRKKIINNVRFIFPNDQGCQEIAQSVYDKMFQGYVNPQIQLKILIQICKKGWEYLSFFICRFIKILKKSKEFKGEEIYLQIQQAILN